MRTRFIRLVYPDGTAVGPPIEVGLELPYEPSEAEWEAVAIRTAIEDGLLPAERRHEARARPSTREG